MVVFARLARGPRPATLPYTEESYSSPAPPRFATLYLGRAQYDSKTIGPEAVVNRRDTPDPARMLVSPGARRGRR